MSSLFLSEADIQRITEINRGRAGQSRDQLQCLALREIGIPFTTSRLGRPLVSRSLYENLPAETLTVAKWQPQALSNI